MGKYEVDRDHEKVHPEEEREGAHLTLELAESLVCEDVLCGVGMWGGCVSGRPPLCEAVRVKNGTSERREYVRSKGVWMEERGEGRATFTARLAFEAEQITAMIAVKIPHAFGRFA